MDFQQPREQAWFRKGYSTIYHFHVVNQVIDKSAEYTKLRYTAFIDYERALDFVFTAVEQEALEDEGTEEFHIRLLEDMYKECTARITIHKQSNNFPIRKGVR